MNTLELDIDATGVARMNLNRPKKHNAMDGEMIAELEETARRLGKDPAVRAVVLSGNGPTFCAGGDLNWMKAQIGANGATRAAEAKKLAMMLQTLNTLPKPLIGRVQGNAFGGGLGLACVCDVAIGVTGSKFGFTETRLGLLPATIGPYVIARMGEAKARRVFMSARLFDAKEACELGVIAKFVSAENLDEAIAREVEPYLVCAPQAVAEAKALARRLGPRIDEATIAESIDALVSRWESDEAAEGIDAFFSKRQPRWVQET